MTTPAQPQPATNTRTIAKNSFWYGAETGLLFLTTLITSIAMARVIGPQKLGYFNYIMWLANTTGLIGSLGIPGTTSKYMAEFLGRGDKATTRAIFAFTMRLQGAMAGVITVGSLVILYTWGDPQYRLVSAFQVASVFPAMLTAVPAQANAAREYMKANTIASFVGNVIYTVSILLSLALGWNLLGIAIGIFVYRSVEFLVRVVPVWKWIGSLPVGRLDKDLQKRMFKFSGNNILLMLLNLIVWDRSDVVMLKFLSSDIAQISFFAVGFNLVEKALIVPQTFASSVNITINAQYGRDSSRISSIVSASTRFLVLFSAPLLLGLAAISSPAVRVLYGHQYIPAIPVLAVAAMMALPKILGNCSQVLQVHEQQKFLVIWGLICGAINVGLDWVLIPQHGALGAAIGNGIAQLFGVIGPWIMVKRRFGVHIDVAPLAKTVLAAALMGCSVAALQIFLKPALTLAVGIPLGALVFFGAVRGLKAVREEDFHRLMHFGRMVPVRVRPTFSKALGLISGYPPAESQIGS